MSAINWVADTERKGIWFGWVGINPVITLQEDHLGVRYWAKGRMTNCTSVAEAKAKAEREWKERRMAAIKELKQDGPN